MVKEPTDQCSLHPYSPQLDARPLTFTPLPLMLCAWVRGTKMECMSHCWYDRSSPQAPAFGGRGPDAPAGAGVAAVAFATFSGRTRSVPPFVPWALVGVTCPHIISTGHAEQQSSRQLTAEDAVVTPDGRRCNCRFTNRRRMTSLLCHNQTGPWDPNTDKREHLWPGGSMATKRTQRAHKRKQCLPAIWRVP